MCTVLLPPGENPIAVNKYIKSAEAWSWPPLTGVEIKNEWILASSYPVCFRGMLRETTLTLPSWFLLVCVKGDAADSKAGIPFVWNSRMNLSGRTFRRAFLSAGLLRSWWRYVRCVRLVYINTVFISDVWYFWESCTLVWATGGVSHTATEIGTQQIWNDYKTNASLY